MLCQHCNSKQATVKLERTLNGIKSTVHLCSSCYKKACGKNAAYSAKSIMDALLEGGNTFAPVLRCEVCGTTFADYDHDGLLGCACCYDAFKEQLLPIIARIHGKTTHVGKVNQNYTEHDLQRKLASLQEELENAVREKRFNRAGVINSQIERVKRQIEGGNGYGR